MKKQCLLLCYYFPPAFMAYAQRVAKLCKYLPPETGWIPQVVCGELPWDQLAGQDNTLLEEIPREISITRVGSFLSSPLARRLRAWHLYKPVGLWRKIIVTPDNFGDWVKPVVRAAETKFPQGKGIKAILASGPPNSVYVAGTLLSKRWNCPLVMDMRDPWKSLVAKPTWLQHFYFQKVKKIEQESYQQASAIIANTRGNLEDLQEFFPSFADKIILIPNGYDPEDINPKRGPKLSRLDEPEGAINFLYLGGFRGRGFEDPFFEALAAYLQDNPQERFCIKMHCVGWTYSQLARAVNRFGLQEVCEAYGIVPAREVGCPLAEADIYVLLVAAQSPGWIPAKLYYYLAGGKPILAIIPEGSAHDILALLGPRAEISAPDNKENAKKALASIIRRVRESKDSRANMGFPPYARPYDRRVIAQQVGAILDKVAG